MVGGRGMCALVMLPRKDPNRNTYSETQRGGKEPPATTQVIGNWNRQDECNLWLCDDMEKKAERETGLTWR
jgi:hypothetical protein